MKRKILAFTLMLLLAFSSVSLAAVSSSKSSSPSRSSSSTTVKPSTPQAAPGTSGSSGYKPSAPASSYSDTAPSAQNKTSTGFPSAQQSSSGGFWRNAGFFGGGMLLGGLLGNMFGFGHSGMLSSIAGMLSDLIILALVVLAVRWAWNRFSGRNQDNRRNM